MFDSHLNVHPAYLFYLTKVIALTSKISAFAFLSCFCLSLFYLQKQVYLLFKSSFTLPSPLFCSWRSFRSLLFSSLRTLPSDATPLFPSLPSSFCSTMPKRKRLPKSTAIPCPNPNCNSKKCFPSLSHLQMHIGSQLSCQTYMTLLRQRISNPQSTPPPDNSSQTLSPDNTLPSTSINSPHPPFTVINPSFTTPSLSVSPLPTPTFHSSKDSLADLEHLNFATLWRRWRTRLFSPITGNCCSQFPSRRNHPLENPQRDWCSTLCFRGNHGLGPRCILFWIQIQPRSKNVSNTNFSSPATSFYGKPTPHFRIS